MCVLTYFVCYCVLSLVVFAPLFWWFEHPKIMSQASSHPILLRLFLDHFKDFKDCGHHDELDRLRSGCLRNLSELKSSTFHTNWLLEDLSIIGKTKDVIHGRPGHPDQIPYISV